MTNDRLFSNSIQYTHREAHSTNREAEATTPNTKNEIPKKNGIELSSTTLCIKALFKLVEYIYYYITAITSDLKCTKKVQSSTSTTPKAHI